MTRISLFRQALFLCCALLFAATGRAQDPFATSSGNNALLSGDDGFLKVEQAYPLALDRDGNGDVLLFWPIADGYYLYRKRFQFHAVDGAERHPLEATFPAGTMREDEFFGLSEVYYGDLLVRLPDPGLSVPYVIEVVSQGCADAGLCYPPRRQYFRLDEAGGAFLEVDSASLAAPDRSDTERTLVLAEQQASPLMLMCLFALLGGLILNLMPCVFPVLSLKVLSLAGAVDESTRHRMLHGLSYTAGVVLSFLVVAGLLLSLRGVGAAIGWGFHLQAPWFVAALAYLFFAMGLSMSGLLELGSGLMGSGSSLSARTGLTGSFFTGVLAMVVASPCTAPFMGTALGFALTQPAASALAVFAALGVGMALPFLLLALIPALMKSLPRPGPWMLNFRRLLAFPMYAAAVWLLWVLGNQTGVNGMAAVTGGAVLIAMGLWLWSAASGDRSRVLARSASALALLAALLVLRSQYLEPQAAGPRMGDGWEVYSAERAAELRRAGEPYFVNVTADWCLTCLANERYALSDGEVKEAFTRFGITYLKGDWTNADPKLTRLLRDHGRSGVPLYLLVNREGQTEILPQLLTPDLLLRSMARTMDATVAQVSRN